MKLTKLMVTALLLILLFGSGQHHAAAQSQVPRFEPDPCATFEVLENAPDAVEGKDVTCGYLIVPEQRVTPTDKTIKLGIVIIKSTSTTPAEPLVMAQGGPGGSSIEIYRSLASPADPVGQLLRADRDLIAFEQRGTRYSQPFLFCDEALNLTLRGFQEKFSQEDEERLSLEAYDACKKRLEGEGISLAAFNSEENAHDVADLAKALGYQQINFYGVSYGTMLGQHLVRLHPEVVRTFTLDGIVPLNVNAFQRTAQSLNHSLDQLFATCTADANCNKYYPNLEQVLFETVKQLNEKPLPIVISDMGTQINYNTTFKGDDLLGIVSQLFYATDAIPLLPKIIYDARAGNVDIPEIVTSLLGIDRSMAEGMYFSVACAEEYFYDKPMVEGVRPVLAENAQTDTDAINRVCADWRVPRLDAAADDPVATDIPALLMSGNFDPVTPPPYGVEVASHLSHATNVVFPVNGHGAFPGECSGRIIKDFLNNPAATPDTSCAATPATPQFLTPATHLMSPGATFLLRRVYRALFDSANPANWADLIGALAWRGLLLGLILFFPAVWLLRWLIKLISRKKPGEQRRLAHLAPWLVVLWLLVAITFVVLHFVGVGVTTFGGTLFTATAGFSRDYLWIFSLPWLLALVTVGMLTIAVVSWPKGYWGIVGRVYYSLIALLAVLYVLSLVNVGVFEVLFS